MKIFLANFVCDLLSPDPIACKCIYFSAQDQWIRMLSTFPLRCMATARASYALSTAAGILPIYGHSSVGSHMVIIQ